VPLGFSGYRAVSVHLPGYVPRENESMAVLSNRIGDRYFETLGIAVREGRGIEARDTADSQRVVVVNQAFVDRFVSGRAALGQSVDIGSVPATIVGVVANGKYRFDALEDAAPPFVYLAFNQEAPPVVTLHVRSSGAAGALVPSIRQVFAAVSPDLLLTGVTSLVDYTSAGLFPVRLGSAFLSGLGLVALLLAAMGLYGVMAYRVAQRAREFALRMALGASRSDVFRLVFRDGALQTAGGLVAGVAVALAVARGIAMAVPQLAAADLGIFTTAIAALLAIAFIAAVLPALRASRVEPAVVLRDG
jgi:ABC-type antimicrobial peptide transport system permease subunit